MSSPLSAVADGYANLASTLAQRWAGYASKMASKVDSGTYSADGAVKDLAAFAYIAAESWFFVATEALDAVAILSGRQHERHIVQSRHFVSPLPGATLALSGPLTNGFATQLPVDIVQVNPPELGSADTVFRLSADATGRRAGTYVGAAVASRVDASQDVVVWITVP